jgi:hypothetical protein
MVASVTPRKALSDARQDTLVPNVRGRWVHSIRAGGSADETASGIH